MLIPISDPADPRIADYSGVRDAHVRERARDPASAPPGVFIAEGELVVRQLIDSGLHTRSMLLTPARLQTVRDAVSRLPAQTPIYVADQPVLNAIAGFNIHRGILAAGTRPSPPDLEAILSSARTLVILEDLSNHDNIGGIFRATAALASWVAQFSELGSRIPPSSAPGPSPSAILLSPRCADPLYRKSIRVSMGTALRIPFARLDPWPGSLSLLKSAGFTLLALTPNPTATPINSLPLPIPSSPDLPTPFRPAILLGAEGPGLSPAALAAADLRVRIPIDPRADSLNVVTAAAIALHRLCSPSALVPTEPRP